MGLDFEPYYYGPFTMQVMEVATELQQNRAIKVGRTDYKADSDLSDKLSPEEGRNIDAQLSQFSAFLNQDFSFDNLELFGTVRCIQALKENGMPADRHSAYKEFRDWKGRKYLDEAVNSSYDILVEFLVPKP